jgi:acyl-CoA thioester hydrolase
MSEGKTSSSGAIESRFRVRYAETDQMGVVYHANYLVWMEIGRTDYCRARGFRYADMEAAHGTFLAVADAQCRYHLSARYDDEIVVRTQAAELRSRLAKFQYRIHRAADDALLAEGETTHVVVNREGRPTRFPAPFLDLLKGDGRV